MGDDGGGTPWCTPADGGNGPLHRHPWRSGSIGAKIGHCVDGLRVCVRQESSLRMVLMFTLLLQAAVMWCSPLPVRQRALAATGMLSGPLLEIVNSAVERCIDRVGLAFHELSREAKDIAAAASMCAQLLNVLVAVVCIV